MESQSRNRRKKRAREKKAKHVVLGTKGQKPFIHNGTIIMPAFVCVCVMICGNQFLVLRQSVN